MSLLTTKGPIERVTDAVDTKEILRAAARSTLESALGQANGQSPVDAMAKNSKPLSWKAKPGLMIAGGIAGVTAASAAVSAVRRKQQEQQA